jgi:polyketide cyclase/dehydrase/lipid transport protein
MGRYQIEATEQTTADPATVYALLRDGSTWPQWSTTIDSFVLEKEGEGEPEGVGAVRIFRGGGITGRDEILAFTPDTAFSYAHLKGLPVRGYRGDVDLRQKDGGTEIHWRVSYDPLIPGTGWLMQRALTRFLGKTVRGLAAYSSRKAGFVG